MRINEYELIKSFFVNTVALKTGYSPEQTNTNVSFMLSMKCSIKIDIDVITVTIQMKMQFVVLSFADALSQSLRPPRRPRSPLRRQPPSNAALSNHSARLYGSIRRRSVGCRAATVTRDAA